MRKRILLVLLLGSLIPIKQTIVPGWTAQVVDSSGAPQPNVDVRQVWQQYSLESNSHQETLRSDASGIAKFPARVLWRPPLFNLIGVIWNTLSQGVHASYGPVAYLSASTPNAQAFADRCENCQLVLQPTHVSIPNQP